MAILCSPTLTLPMVYVAAVAGTMTEVIFPAVTAVKANNAAPHEQGSVQGAIFGARSVALGVGPLFFAAMFQAFTHPPERHSSLPFLPQAPFLAAFVLIGLGLALALTLPTPHGGGAGGAVPVVGEADAREHQARAAAAVAELSGTAGAGAAGDAAGGGAPPSPGGGRRGASGARRFFWGSKSGGNKPGGRDVEELSRPLLPEFDEGDEVRAEAEIEASEEEEGAVASPRRPQQPAGGEPAAPGPGLVPPVRRASALAAGGGLIDGDMEAGDGRHLIHPQ